MTLALLDLPESARRRLARNLRAGRITPPYSAVALNAAGLSATESVVAATELDRLAQLGVAGAGAAAWIEAIEDASRRVKPPDFVWSGPEAPGLHARDTRAVFDQLLSTAEESIWVSTYAFFDGPKAFEALAKRMEERPNLNVRMLLNVHRKHGDPTPPDDLVATFAYRFWKHEWPGERRPAVFYDPRSVELPPAGVLHAKAIVVDDAAVLITSANFTEAALEKNIEVGVLLRDPALSQTVVRHFAALVERGLVCPLPG